MAEKLRYETDPHNRLVVGERKIPLRRFRKVLDGRFKVDRNNTLSYHVKTPAWDDNIPHQFKLTGEWSLTKGHDLKFTLDKWGRQTFGDKLTIKGRILDVRKNSLLFAVTTISKEGTRSTYVLDLSGSWQADRYNRLTFKVRRENGRYDILTLSGTWKINDTHQIIYRYKKAELIKAKKEVHALTFKGYWQMDQRMRVSYVLDVNSNSVFNFKTAIGKLKNNRIIYELGIGAARAREYRTLTLSGKWRIRKNVGLVFEVRYEGGRVRNMVFGADVALTKKDTLSFKLKNDISGKDLGATLEISHKILKGNGTAFLKALKSRQETGIYTGAAWRW